MLTLNRVQLLSYLPQNGNVAEIGVDKGDFSKLILEKNNPKKLTLIDPWIEMLDIKKIDENHQGKYLQVKEMFKDEDRIQIIKDTSVGALTHIPSKSLDWLYIDGDHKFEGCLTDLRSYSDKVKDDGYICGHDWTTAPKIGFGVNDAVETFLNETGYLLCGLTSEKNFKSYVIAKNKESKQKFDDSVR